MPKTDKKIITYTDLCRGMQLALWGMIEIVVIGFRADAIVDGVVEMESAGMLFTLGGIAMYILELYLYLDGGWNIIRGLGQCVGARLGRNPFSKLDRKWLTIIIVLLFFTDMILLKFGFSMLTGMFSGLMPVGVEFSVFNIKKTLLGLGMEKIDYEVFALMLFFTFVVEILHLKGVSVREWIEKRNIVLRWPIYLLGILLVVVVGYYGVPV